MFHDPYSRHVDDVRLNIHSDDSGITAGEKPAKTYMIPLISVAVDPAVSGGDMTGVIRVDQKPPSTSVLAAHSSFQNMKLHQEIAREGFK